ncbi:MAG TPA: hypothetical protein VFG95_04895, partial [Nitrospiria bacterium]|nr:hypothetical protein [Nitrospiria bacterium]
DIFGGTLVTIPLRMTGPFDKTTVAYYPVREIGSGLIGMMKRTVNAPFTLINPEKTGSSEAKTVR